MIIYDNREARLREAIAILNPPRKIHASVAHERVHVVKPKPHQLYAHFGRISFVGNFYFQRTEEK